MKKYLFVSLPIFLLLAFTKDGTNTNTTKTPEQLLTAKSWIFSEGYQIDDWAKLSYKRGFTTVQYVDNDKMTFLSNNTGTYFNGLKTYNITWSFTDSEKTRMSISIIGFNSANGFPSNPTDDLVLTWYNVTIKENIIKYAQTYSKGNGMPSVAYWERIPAP